MATFLARRYMRGVEAVGRREQVLGGLILLLTIVLVAGFVLHVLLSHRPAAAEQAPQDAAPQRLPLVDADGWHGPTESAYFAAEQMYEKINGQADEYLRLGALGLTFGRYERVGDASLSVDVYCFHMRSAQEAHNAYQAERPPTVTELAVGDGGYEVGGAVFLTQGAHYVQILPSRPDEHLAPATRRIADALARHLSRSAGTPSANGGRDHD